MDILEQLEELIDQSSNRRFNNSYINDEKMTAYIRITTRLIQGQMTQTIDIGNVSVNEEHQKQGVFRKFLEGVERLAHRFDKTVYIESVLSQVLIDKLPSYGYTSNQEICPSFYKTM